MNKYRFLVTLLLVGLVFSATTTKASTSAIAVTWHESVKQDASFKWKVSKNVNMTNEAIFIDEMTQGIEYEVRITDVPPTDKAVLWSAITDTYSWADLYVNGTRNQKEEGYALLFITPLTTNQSSVEKAGYNIPYDAYRGFIAFLSFFAGALFQNSTSTPDANTWKGSIRSTFTVGTEIHDLYVDMTYSTETGLLKEFSYVLENSTNKEELKVVPVSEGPLGDLPGFEFPVTVGGLLGLLAVVIVQRKKK